MPSAKILFVLKADKKTLGTDYKFKWEQIINLSAEFLEVIVCLIEKYYRLTYVEGTKKNNQM